VIDDSPVGLGHERGISARAHTDRALQDSEDWRAAKSGDADAALRVVESVWTPDRTKALAARLDPAKETLFVSVPSTSGRNELPKVLGRHLVQRLGGVFEDGDAYFKSKHEAPVKGIPPRERPFAIRAYQPVERTTLRLAAQGRNVVVTEDVFTTGASAKAFVRALNESGIHVESVAGIMGDARLDPEPQLVSKLARTLRHAGIGVRAKDLAALLSKGEVNVIIQNIHEARTDHERDELARNLQGLLDERTPSLLGPLLRGQRTQSSRGEDSGNARPAERVQDRAGIQKSWCDELHQDTGIHGGVNSSQFDPSALNHPGLDPKAGAFDHPSDETTPPRGRTGRDGGLFTVSKEPLPKSPPLTEPLRQSARNYLEAEKAYKASFHAPRAKFAQRLAATQKSKEKARLEFVTEATRFINSYGVEAFRTQMNEIAGPKATELSNEVLQSRGKALETGLELSLTSHIRLKGTKGEE